MKRKSLNERLGRQQGKNAVVDVLVHMSVVDYLRAISPVNGSSIRAYIRLASQAKQMSVTVDPMMCNTVAVIARARDPSVDEVLYELLVEPIFKLYEQEATHEHTVCDTRDSVGPDQDDDGGRSVPTP